MDNSGSDGGLPMTLAITPSVWGMHGDDYYTLKDDQFKQTCPLASFPNGNLFAAWDSPVAWENPLIADPEQSLQLESPTEILPEGTSWPFHICGISHALPGVANRCVGDVARTRLELPPPTKYSDPPYYKLIEAALSQAKDHVMTTSELYRWFLTHTRKPAECNSAKGWRNSIRHNLSKNEGFVRRRYGLWGLFDDTWYTDIDGDEPRQPAKVDKRRAGYGWTLTDEAKKYGVRSTSSYHKPSRARIKR